MKTCPECEGYGGDQGGPCGRCGGIGKVPVTARWPSQLTAYVDPEIERARTFWQSLDVHHRRFELTDLTQLAKDIRRAATPAPIAAPTVAIARLVTEARIAAAAGAITPTASRPGC